MLGPLILYQCLLSTTREGINFKKTIILLNTDVAHFQIEPPQDQYCMYPVIVHIRHAHRRALYARTLDLDLYNTHFNYQGMTHLRNSLNYTLIIVESGQC